MFESDANHIFALSKYREHQKEIARLWEKEWTRPFLFASYLSGAVPVSIPLSLCPQAAPFYSSRRSQFTVFPSSPNQPYNAYSETPAPVSEHCLPGQGLSPLNFSNVIILASCFSLCPEH